MPFAPCIAVCRAYKLAEALRLSSTNFDQLQTVCMFAHFGVCSQTIQHILEQTRNHENSCYHQPKRWSR
jgi:hypothetical protein